MSPNPTAMPITDTAYDLHSDPPPLVPSEYQAEIDALATEQGCGPSDLVHLIDCVRAANAADRQLPGALRQACTRLLALRSAQDSAVEFPAPEVAAAVARARDALEPGPTFSLERADQAFADAVASCRQAPPCAPATLASLLARQAAVAALGQDHRRAADLYAAAAATPALPVEAQWHYQCERAAALEERGREYGDNAALEESIELYSHAVLPLAPESERPDDWSVTQHRLGNALGIAGQRRRGVHYLERSIAAFEQALQGRSRERAPLDWAATQLGLGNALGILAQRQGDDDMLRRAVAAFEGALQALRRDTAPREWAMAQYHLGTALLTLGQLKRDTAMLARSIDAYRQVLRDWTRARAPLDWARVQNSLGTALRVRGEQGNDRVELEQAIGAYRSALEVWTRARWPEEWSLAQNNLGAALQRLGERQDDPAPLCEAIAAYDAALQEMRPDDRPIAWAMTRANLGDARRALAERARDADLCGQAICDFEAVAKVFREASHPQYYDLAKERLAVARKLAAELGA
ncbi:MAG: hypothetical protein WCZ87_04180 [Thiohalobacteraceae bacterium]